MKHLYRKKFVSVVLAGVLALSAAGCGARKENDANTISIAYLPITHALALLEQAEMQKNNPGYTIELVKYSSWPDLMDALNTGSVDGASVLMELAMKAEEQIGNLTAVALGHADGNVIVASNEITKASDFAGKTFAIPNTSSSHNILFRLMCEQEGVKVSDINIVEMSPSEMPSALSGGQIAGYCVAEPFGAKAVTMGIGQVLHDSTDLWKDSQCCALVLTDRFLQENGDRAKKFVSDYAEAGRNLAENPEQAMNIASQYLAVDDATLEQSLRWISFADLTISKEAYQTLCDYTKLYGISENPPSYESFVNTELIGS